MANDPPPPPGGTPPPLPDRGGPPPPSSGGIPPPPGAQFGNAPPGYVPYGGPTPMAGGGSRTNGMAVASLVLGIVGVLLCFLFIPWILAIVFGAIAIRQCNADPTYSGKGMAVAGLVLGLVAAVFVVFVLAVGTFDYQIG